MVEKPTTERKVPLLVGEQYHQEVQAIADLLNKNLSAVTEEAVHRYYNAVIYSPQEFWKFVKKNPRLSLFYEDLKKAFVPPCCYKMFREIMQLDEKCAGLISFGTFLFDEKENKIEDFLNARTEKAVMVVKICPKGNYKELLDKVATSIEKRNANVNIHSIYDEEHPIDTVEIFAFVRFKKEGDGDAKK